MSKTFFSNKNYPAELTNIPDKNLVGLSCSNFYTSDYKDGYLSTGGSTQTQLTDKKLLSFFKKASPNNAISAGMYCTTEDDRTLLEYEIWGGGGGGNNTAYIGLVSLGNIDIKSKIPNDGIAYFQCDSILQLTREGLLYIMCRGGDGGGAGASIYSIDLTGNLKQLQKCTSIFDKTTCTKD